MAAERRDHRVDEIARERHLEPDVVVDDLDLDVVATIFRMSASTASSLAGQSADVDERFGAIGDDVVLVARRENRRVGRRPQRRSQEGRCRARRRCERVWVVGIPAGELGETVEQGVVVGVSRTGHSCAPSAATASASS